MSDPRTRGKRAYRALGFLGSDARTFVEGTIGEHSQLVLKQGGSIMSLVHTLAAHEQFARWCSHVSHNTESRITSEDAAAALVSLYFKASIRNDVLYDSYRSQMAAILGTVLKGAIGVTKLFYAWDDAAKTTGKAYADSNAGRAGVWDNILLPLGDLMLESMASLRLAPEISQIGDSTIIPFGWSPKVDNFHGFLEFVLLGGRSRSRQNAGFLHCGFTNYLVRHGHASIVPFEVFCCEDCRRRFIAASDRRCCIRCGKELQRQVRPLCLSMRFLANCVPKAGPDGKIHFALPDKTIPQAALPAEVQDPTEPVAQPVAGGA